jgi:hypothetical protein
LRVTGSSAHAPSLGMGSGLPGGRPLDESVDWRILLEASGNPLDWKQPLGYPFADAVVVLGRARFGHEELFLSSTPIFRPAWSSYRAGGRTEVSLRISASRFIHQELLQIR